VRPISFSLSRHLEIAYSTRQDISLAGQLGSDSPEFVFHVGARLLSAIVSFTSQALLTRSIAQGCVAPISTHCAAARRDGNQQA
jgi:hypothetical protein